MLCLLIILLCYSKDLRKLTNPSNVAKTFSDVEMQFDYTVPIARMLQFLSKVCGLI